MEPSLHEIATVESEYMYMYMYMKLKRLRQLPVESISRASVRRITVRRVHPRSRRQCNVSPGVHSTNYYGIDRVHLTVTCTENSTVLVKRVLWSYWEVANEQLVIHTYVYVCVCMYIHTHAQRQVNSGLYGGTRADQERRREVGLQIAVRQVGGGVVLESRWSSASSAAWSVGAELASSCLPSAAKWCPRRAPTLPGFLPATFLVIVIIINSSVL